MERYGWGKLLENKHTLLLQAYGFNPPKTKNFVIDVSGRILLTQLEDGLKKKYAI